MSRVCLIHTQQQRAQHFPLTQELLSRDICDCVRGRDAYCRFQPHDCSQIINVIECGENACVVLSDGVHEDSGSPPNLSAAGQEYSNNQISGSAIQTAAETIPLWGEQQQGVQGW